jgi:hypothetical protein
MASYIVCQKKRNNPRMDVRICQKKCALKDDCQEYISFHKIALQSKDIVLVPETQPLQIELA